MDGRPTRGSKNGTNGAKNAGSSSSASTRASSSGSRSTSGDNTDSHKLAGVAARDRSVSHSQRSDRAQTLDGCRVRLIDQPSGSLHVCYALRARTSLTHDRNFLYRSGLEVRETWTTGFADLATPIRYEAKNIRPSIGSSTSTPRHQNCGILDAVPRSWRTPLDVDVSVEFTRGEPVAAATVQPNWIDLLVRLPARYLELPPRGLFAGAHFIADMDDFDENGDPHRFLALRAVRAPGYERVAAGQAEWLLTFDWATLTVDAQHRERIRWSSRRPAGHG